MISWHRTIAAGLLALTLFGGSVSAADRPQLTGEEWISLRLQGLMRGDKSVDTIRTLMLRQFSSADIDGGGVSESDYTLKEQMSQAQRRAGLVSQWLKLDLDGNGEVTRAEIQVSFIGQARQPLSSSGVVLTPTPEQIAQTLEKLVGDVLKQDANGDGIVTFAESLVLAHEMTVQGRRSSPAADRSIPLSLDQNGDGVVSEAEFSQLLDRVLGAIDADGDGAFSAQEISLHAQRAKGLQEIYKAEKRALALEAKDRELVESCGFPQPSKDAVIVLVSGYEGQALSTVSLGGDDSVVTVANARIEPGREPLYILLTSHAAMIWRFSGAVERIAQVVASSSNRDAGGVPQVGIVGLAPERVFVPNRADCLPYFTNRKVEQKNRTVALVANLVGRGADVVAGDYALNAVSIPSVEMNNSAVYEGALPLNEAGPSAPVWREMLRFNPGGLVEVDAEAVVARSPAKRYGTLPQQAGLARLVEEGALQVVGAAKHMMVNGTRIVVGDGDDVVVAPKGVQPEIFVVPSHYRILKKMRFPAGLAGAHSVLFILAPGVPMPDGSPGHSKITN